MILTILLHDRFTASIRQSIKKEETFWQEMSFVQWFLIRIFFAFYETAPFLPEGLASLYLDGEFLASYVTGNRVEAREPLRASMAAGMIQRPILLNQDVNTETKKYIRSVYPECRMDFKGFGRFLGYNDLNPVVFWSPFLILRYFYLKYVPKGGEILVILKAVSANAGRLFTKGEITFENHFRLAAAEIDALSRKYLSS